MKAEFQTTLEEAVPKGQAYIIPSSMLPRGAVLVLSQGTKDQEIVKVWRRNFKNGRCYVKRGIYFEH